MIRYLVDGYNVLHGLSEYANLLRKDGESARRKLLIRCSGISSAHVKITVVFDGSGDSAAGNVSSLFSGQRTADERIKKIIDGDSHRRNLVVVSGDHEIINYAKDSGCRIMSVVEFQNKLNQGTASIESPSQKTDPQLSSSEMEEWKKLFNS